MRNLFKRVLYVPKYEKLTDENFIQMILPSIIGLVMCAICLVGLTLAWFTASVETGTDTFNTNRFVLTAEVRKDTNHGELLNPTDEWYSLEKDNKYVVILNADGNLGQGSGYAVLTVKASDTEKKYYTEKIQYGNSGYLQFVVTINAVSDFDLKIEYGWGDSGKTQTIKNNDTHDFPPIESPKSIMNDIPAETPDEPTDSLNPDGTYTVRHEETLDDIAAKFNTLPEIIMVYNEFESTDMISEGRKIKIPPKGSRLVKTEIVEMSPNDSQLDDVQSDEVQSVMDEPQQQDKEATENSKSVVSNESKSASELNSTDDGNSDTDIKTDISE